MRMLILLGIIGFLFVLANKSPDQSMGDVVKDITNKSGKIISQIDGKKVEPAKPEVAGPKFGTENSLVNRKSAEKVRKSVPAEISQNNQTSDYTKRIDMAIRKTKEKTKKPATSQKREPQANRDKTKETKTTTSNSVKTQSQVSPQPPKLPPSREVNKRPVIRPKLDKGSEVELVSNTQASPALKQMTPEKLKKLRYREHKYYSEAARALMSIPE